MAWDEDVLERFDAYELAHPAGRGRQRHRGHRGCHRGAPRPTPGRRLIAVRTHIGFGSPNKQDSQKAHGSPLGPDEVRLTKLAYGWDPDAQFYVPDEVRRVDGRGRRRGRGARRGLGGAVRGATRADFPAEAAELRRRLAGRSATDWDAGLKTYAVGEDFATRQVSQAAIQALAGRVPELFGGAADLSESNLTDVKGGADFEADEAGRNLRFGVREHAMGGVAQRHRLPRRVHPVRARRS